MEKDNTGKFLKAGGKNSHTDNIYAKGAVTREPDTTDETEYIQPPKSKNQRTNPKVAAAENTVRISSTAPVVSSYDAMTLNADPKTAQASSQLSASGSLVSNASQIEDMLRTATTTKTKFDDSKQR